jgi:hypothetical protein
MEWEQQIISADDMITYNKLRDEYWVCRWSGEGKLCMVRPANWQERLARIDAELDAKGVPPLKGKE